MTNAGQIWGIFKSPGRRIRLTLQTHNQSAYVNIKLFQTGYPTQTLSLTIAEILLIPCKKIHKLVTNRCWDIYNGLRRICIINNTQNHLISLELNKFKSNVWINDGFIEMDQQEFEEFAKQIVSIVDYASLVLLTPIAGATEESEKDSGTDGDDEMNSDDDILFTLLPQPPSYYSPPDIGFNVVSLDEIANKLLRLDLYE